MDSADDTTFAYTPMSRSQIVDQRYRLQSIDLQGVPVQVVITAVSFQGLEELAPVLHLANGSFKRLALAPEQREALIRVTQSTLCTDWVGCQIALYPGIAQTPADVVIVSPGALRQRQWPILRAPPQASTLKRAIWPLVLVSLALLFVFLLERSEIGFEQILSLFP